MKLKENLYYVGVIDHELKVFDAIMPLTYGTSYNSYLLKTEEGGVLFEGSKAFFEEEYLANIESILPLSEIKYLVVAHTEPDHSGAIEALLKKNPEITLVLSPAANNNMKNILKFPFKSMVVTPSKELKVGQYTLSFVSGLFLHWPDVLFTYIKEEKALVTCDGFGTHYAFDDILLSKVNNRKEYRESFDYYFDCIMSPFAAHCIQACDRVRKLDLEMLLVGHGPVVDCDVKKVIDAFEEDAKKHLVTSNPAEVTLVYASCYGYTKQMAFALEKDLKEAGKTVHAFEIDALNFQALKPEILQAMQSSSMILFGSPTVVNDALEPFYDLLLSKTVTFYQNKRFAAFGDFGWSGEATKNLTAFAELRKMKTSEPFAYAFKVDEAGFEKLHEWLKAL